MFCFKQKTAYEIEYGLVGSEMCIRDRLHGVGEGINTRVRGEPGRHAQSQFVVDDRHSRDCLLYTSDAADERSSVDLGGRRIIKKKNTSIYATRSDLHKATVVRHMCQEEKA